jgi:glutamyl-Q tRNA(Asp) synthetase
LHVGSLLTAVASFLHARQSGGEWLVRIEDIDPPREVPGATDQILRTLEAFDLEWDHAVLHQSSRLDAYRETAEQLLAAGRAFRCRCTRSEIRSAHDGPPARYPGTCRNRHLPQGDVAIRVLVDPGTIGVEDRLQGALANDLSATTGDYVIVRRDGLPAYHLAVVLDDAAQGITTIVRGVDLLESTATHVHLQGLLGLPTPQYYHLPVVVNGLGQKLSKQTGAAAVSGPETGMAAGILGLLGLAVPLELERERPAVLWQWALNEWDIARLRGSRAILLGGQK